MTASGASLAASYAYDPLDRRTQKSGTGVTQTFFLDDGDNEIAEYNGTGGIQRRFVPGPAPNDFVAEVTSGGTVAYFHDDKAGSTIAMSSATGVPTEGPYLYDPFGNGGPITGVPFKFTGQYLDAETGLYFDRARYYSASLGRFYQTDPVGYTEDLNLYTYVGNDPTDKTDPTGRDELRDEIRYELREQYNTSAQMNEAGRQVRDAADPPGGRHATVQVKVQVPGGAHASAGVGGSVQGQGSGENSIGAVGTVGSEVGTGTPAELKASGPSLSLEVSVGPGPLPQSGSTTMSAGAEVPVDEGVTMGASSDLGTSNPDVSLSVGIGKGGASVSRDTFGQLTTAHHNLTPSDSSSSQTPKPWGGCYGGPSMNVCNK